MYAMHIKQELWPSEMSDYTTGISNQDVTCSYHMGVDEFNGGLCLLHTLDQAWLISKQ